MPESQNDEVDLKTFLIDITTDIVEELVEDRTKVKIVSETTNNSVSITISVLNGEMGKIIGRNGQTIRALRHLLNAMAFKEQIRISLRTTNDEKPDASE